MAIVNVKDATEYIIECLKVNLVCMLAGQPGIGKSAIIYAIAQKFNLQLIDLRLSQCDPVDLNGFPTVVKKPIYETKKFKDKNGDIVERLMDTGKTRNIATYIPMDTFPLDSTPLPVGKRGWLLFLDEFNSAPISVQAASYKLILDRMVGTYNLHKDVAIVCAGNLISDGAIVNRMSTAMQSRLVHLELGTDIKQWTDWASANKLNHKVIAYLGSRPEYLHDFDPDHNDKTFACPRTWEFVSKIVESSSRPLTEMVPLISGIIGEAVAREFIIYSETYTKLPTMAEIIKDPTNAKLDRNEPGLLFAVSHMIAAHLNKSNLSMVMPYIKRLPVEFETITLQNAIKRDETMIDEAPILAWMAAKGSVLFT